jgi:hypothetical protein
VSNRKTLLMKNALAILLLSVVLISCEEGFDSAVPCQEGVEATVRDLTGLDGCGYVFVLKDGTKLEPLRLLYCGTPPLPKEVTEDPLYQFEFEDGKKVIIGYEETKAGSYCMVGPVVKIVCLTEVGTSQETETK